MNLNINNLLEAHVRNELVFQSEETVDTGHASRITLPTGDRGIHCVALPLIQGPVFRHPGADPAES